jgi:NAD(P)-dependent dehydrogenase (short-subunit alcohol dehydrogenase family)
MVLERGVALITGAGGGIGWHVARDLGRAGWKIAALDKQTQGLESLKQELAAVPQECAWVEGDVTNADELKQKVAELTAQLGPVDLLLACAGIAPETPAEDMDAHVVERVIRINLIGASNTIAAVLPSMLERQQGHIVAISSLASFRGLPCEMAYCASKAGLNALMESLRLDMRNHNIHVTTICPGWTRTAQTKGYDEADLMDVEETAREIMKAIDRQARFCAFPRGLAWQLRLLNLLPRSVQDLLLLRRIRKLKKGRKCLKTATKL